MTSQALIAGENPERLYADRANVSSAEAAAEIWSRQLRDDPISFDAAWRLSRACYWLGGHTAAAKQKEYWTRGITAGRTAAMLQPSRPEGHFWTAANMGALAENAGIRAGLSYRKPIKEELETVLRIDPSFQQGSADRALGRWYFKVPRLFGGSHTRAEEHLRASLTYDPASTISHYFLAELLIDADRKKEAREELQRVLDAPISAEFAPEDREYKEKARALLSKLF